MFLTALLSLFYSLHWGNVTTITLFSGAVRLVAFVLSQFNGSENKPKYRNTTMYDALCQGDGVVPLSVFYTIGFFDGALLRPLAYFCVKTKASIVRYLETCLWAHILQYLFIHDELLNDFSLALHLAFPNRHRTYLQI